jgi:arylsulfatase A-like enzyme
VGFDWYFGISASLDMVPYTYIENDRVVEFPSLDRDFLMMHGRSDGPRTRKGPAAPGFEADAVLPTLGSKCEQFIARQASSARDGKPFFLYVPLASPHTPILPNQDWQGKSRLNPYADFVMQTDSVVGKIIQALASNGLDRNTLVIVTSDNGCSPQAKFDELQALGHDPSGPLRGHKADIFEGGHRVPLLIRWTGQIPGGTTSDQLVCLTDLFATIAEILGASVPPNAAEDSFSFWPNLKTGRSSERDHLVSHSINGSFAIREGSWKLALCADSGGWSPPRPGSPAARDLPPFQLFDLASDLGETRNLSEQQPDRVKSLTSLLERLVENGRSTPGPPQRNTGQVNIRSGQSDALR